jgi:hypothetical protein
LGDTGIIVRFENHHDGNENRTGAALKFETGVARLVDKYQHRINASRKGSTPSVQVE